MLLLLIRIMIIKQVTRTATLPASTNLNYLGWLLALFALPRFKMASYGPGRTYCLFLSL